MLPFLVAIASCCLLFALLRPAASAPPDVEDEAADDDLDAPSVFDFDFDVFDNSLTPV